ncbi:MAG: OmpP1/FadL family transporter [Lactobacillales bacterium]|nr:OmpP1/FadL family transporter [Lactobacillales bacterium]
MKIKTVLFSLCGLLWGTAAYAGGYQLNDYSVTGLGRSFAGAGVVGDDYSALAYNPAGMHLKKSGMQVGVSLIQLKSDVENIGTNTPGEVPGTIRLYQPLPHLFAQYKLNDKWDVGFGIYTPFGLSTRYKRDWFGRYQAVESKLEIVDFAPAVSYRVSDEWTLGVTLIARYIRGKMTNYVRGTDGFSTFDLDGWTKTASFGVMYEPVKDTRFGVSYRMRSKQTVKGNHKVKDLPGPMAFINGTYNGEASPDLPDTVLISAFHKVNKFGFSGSARWTHWTVFEDFVMESDSPLLAASGGEFHSYYNWRNSWTLTAGVDYYYNDKWTFRVGGGWDESPSHDNETRTARIPDNDRIWASCGFSYRSGKWTTDVGYAHMFMKTTRVNHTDQFGTSVNAKYDSQSNMLGVQLQYEF